jgi:hypothetical protein
MITVRGAERHVLGDAGEPAEGAKGLVERGRVALVHIRGDGHVIGSHEQMVAERLDESHAPSQGIGPGARAEVDQIDADFHTVSFLSLLTLYVTPVVSRHIVLSQLLPSSTQGRHAISGRRNKRRLDTHREKRLHDSVVSPTSIATQPGTMSMAG